MSFNRVEVDLKMDWHRPLSVLSLVALTLVFTWRDKDNGLYAVLAFACCIAAFLIYTEVKRVASRKKRLKTWRECVNSSARVRFDELMKQTKSAAVIGIAVKGESPYAVRLSHLPETNETLLELASFVPDTAENEIHRINEKSSEIDDLQLKVRRIGNSSIRSALEAEFFAPFVLPVHAQKEAEFEAAVSAGRGKRAWGKRLFNSWRIRFIPAVIGTFLVVLTTGDAFRANPDPWVYPFWAVGVAMVVFAVRFGISFDGVHLKYCNGLRTYKWKPQEIASVHREFGTVFGFLSESAGTYPMLLLTNGLTADLSLFSYSSKDSAQAYLLIESLYRKQEAKVSA